MWKIHQVLYASRSGVNFIKILKAAFACADPESAKNKVKSSVFLTLLGFAHAKAARSLLMKLIPGCNFVGESKFHLNAKFCWLMHLCFATINC
jgi:hypothetical protein